MSWKVLYPIEDLGPHLPKDEALCAGVKALIFGGVDPRVHDVCSIADKAIKAMQTAKVNMYRQRQKEKANAGKGRS